MPFVSDIVRRAAIIAGGCHGQRVWPIDEKPFVGIPTVMALNLSQGTDLRDETLAATLLYGACDAPSTYTYEQMECDFADLEHGDLVVRAHRQSSWTLVMAENAGQLYGDWDEHVRVYLAHLEHTSPKALQVIAAYEHFKITELQAMCLATGDLGVWERFSWDFPEPYNQFQVVPESPHAAVLDYYQRMINIFRSRYNCQHPVYRELVTVVQEVANLFRTQNLI